MKYTIKDLKTDFPNDDVCLDYLFKQRYGHVPEFGKYYRVSGRKCYAHSETGQQLHPLADTIFHKSSTKLTDWFFAMFLFSQSKNGVSAKELQRSLGVTYKCAYRMGQQIRKLMAQEPSMLTGEVEADETYIGGKKNKDVAGRGAVGKQAVFGAVERGGKIYTKTVALTDAYTLISEIRKNVSVKAHLITDQWAGYKNVNRYGFDHSTINHNEGRYAKGNIHTNTIENCWGQIKRSIRGTYIHVSKRKLPVYLDEFSYRYNRRKSAFHLFRHLLGAV